MRRKHYGRHRVSVVGQIDGNASSKPRPEKEAGGSPYVFAEAKKKKRGGAVLGSVSGAKAKYSLSRPGRKMGARRFQIGGEVGDAPSPAGQFDLKVPPVSQFALRPAINRFRPQSSTRTVSVYDGHSCLGSITVNEAGEAHAFDLNGAQLGVFPTLKAALGALPTTQPEGALLKATPEKSNRQIAAVVQADDKTVGAVRKKLEATRVPVGSGLGQVS